MVRMLEHAPPVAVLNIGGVANLTFIDGKADLIAFDTGPGNALIDDFLRLRTGQMQDDEGRIAAAGRVDEAAVARVLAHPFFAPAAAEVARPQRVPPLGGRGGPAGRQEHGGRRGNHLAITVAAIIHALAVLPRAPASWIAAGGGTRNPTLMRMLKDASPAQLETALAVGWSADALEAQAFAYLAVRALKGLPITFPTTTGVPRPLTGGVVVRG